MNKNTWYSIIIIIIAIIIMAVIIVSYKKQPAIEEIPTTTPNDTTQVLRNSINAVGLDDASISNGFDEIDQDINNL